MEEDAWSFGFSASSRNYQASSLKSRSDFCFELEEIEADDDWGADYPCPFCPEEYDLVELCYHIDDEHPFEPNHGICPICATRVKMNMVEHIAIHHRNILKNEQRRKLFKGGSDLPFASKDRFFPSLLDGSPPTEPSFEIVHDPLLLFIYNSPPCDQSAFVQPDSSTEISLQEKSSNEEAQALEKNADSSSPLSDTEQMEKAKRCEFMQGLLLSSIFDDDAF